MSATELQSAAPFWLERLENRVAKINGAPITAAEGRRLLVDLASGVIEMARTVGRIDRQQKELLKNKKDDSDLMRSGLRWFADKVLPSLMASGIIGGVIWLAAVNGLIG
jgi:hypothetical protein